jgi:hypothetical protein
MGVAANSAERSDTRLVISCEVSRWWSRSQQIGIVVALAGGAAMLLLAAIAHDAASVALVVIGGLWFIMGTLGLRQFRTLPTFVTFDGELIEFRWPERQLAVPVGDLVAVTRSRWDLQRVSWLKIETRSNGVVRLPPRLDNVIELLMALKEANPEIRLANVA